LVPKDHARGAQPFFIDFFSPLQGVIRELSREEVDMPSVDGKLVLMGSGELTATMVEVHKSLLAALPQPPRAVFLDTPAGFQLNVDQISQKAVSFFRRHVQAALSVASFKSREGTPPVDAEKAFHILRRADFILMGPGSPTYAVRQLKPTPVPEILAGRVRQGACLVAASAAALTVGRFTLPVYEIYKVGEKTHWVEGMNVLGLLDMNLVVIPHWNNAEGGTHDTSRCFMGRSRFRRLQAMLPEEVSILGLDEHTACIVDFAEETFEIKGIGRAVLRGAGEEMTFEPGGRFPLAALRDFPQARRPAAPQPPTARRRDQPEPAPDFWSRVHSLERGFHDGLSQGDPRRLTNALLELDRVVWQAQQELEDEEAVTQARDTLREMIALLGTRLGTGLQDPAECLAPLVEAMLEVRSRFRDAKRWQAADALRDALRQAGIHVDDTENGSRWRAMTTNDEVPGRGGSKT
jgi:cyanophycinase-like exopeptidase